MPNTTIPEQGEAWTIELPFPPSALRPNAASPGAWRIKQSAAKRYRADCDILCRAGLEKAAGVERAHLTIQFLPPDRRRRDLDNMLSSFKQGIDAISARIGIDDYHFDLTVLRGQPVEGGKVIVSIGGGAQ